MIILTESGYQMNGRVDPYDHAYNQLKKAVETSGLIIQFIKNPSDEIKRLAVQQNGYAIRHIDNPSKEVQKLAIHQNDKAIKYIDSPS